MSLLINTCTCTVLKRASGGVGRFSGRLRRAIFQLLRLLLAAAGLGVFTRAVLAPALLAIVHTGRIERSADDVVADAGKVLHSPTAHQHDRVLLEAVP